MHSSVVQFEGLVCGMNTSTLRETVSNNIFRKFACPDAYQFYDNNNNNIAKKITYYMLFTIYYFFPQSSFKYLERILCRQCSADFAERIEMKFKICDGFPGGIEILARCARVLCASKDISA